MKFSYIQIIIQTVVLAIFAIGTSLAAGSVCLPGCSNCKPVAVMSCCDGMGPGAGHVHDAGSEHRSSSDHCPHSEICPGELEQINELIVQSIPSVEICGSLVEAIVAANLFESPSLSAAHISSLSDAPLPPLYIFHCSFLI